MLLLDTDISQGPMDYSIELGYSIPLPPTEGQFLRSIHGLLVPKPVLSKDTFEWESSWPMVLGGI